MLYRADEASRSGQEVACESPTQDAAFPLAVDLKSRLAEMSPRIDPMRVLDFRTWTLLELHLSAKPHCPASQDLGIKRRCALAP
jgi:hypothetical protein